MHSTKYDMHQKLLAATAGYDLLIAPTTATPAQKADRRNDDPLIINGQAHPAPYTGWFMTYPFNLLSQFPIMNVPSGGFCENGVPMGVQIIGPKYDDLSVFRAASAFEAATRPWENRRPAL